MPTLREMATLTNPTTKRTLMAHFLLKFSAPLTNSLKTHH